MLNIILLAGSTTHQASPTGTIANKYFKLLSKKHNVQVLFSATNSKQLENVPQNFFPITDPMLNFFSDKKGNIITNRMLIVKTFRKTQRVFNHDLVMPWYYKKGLGVLAKLNKKKKIDLLISISSPFVTHKLAKKFSKQMNIPWISIVIDPLTSERTLFNYWSSRYEKNLFESSNYCLFTKELIKSKVETYKKHSIHFKYLPYLITDNTNTMISSKTDNFVLIYQGSFYKGIREPIYFLDAVSNLPKTYKVLIYSKGKYENVVKEYAGRFPLIDYRGYVSKPELKEALLQSDFFINIENNSPAFAPSKIFEYISYGKPIITFGYKNSVDPYLAKYPLSLTINQNDLTPECAAQRIHEFCQKYSGCKMDFDQIKGIFGENTETSIEELFDECINEVVSEANII